MSKRTITIGIPEDDFPHESEYVTSDYDFDDRKIDYTQWSNVGDGSFIPSPATAQILPAGLYEITWNNKMSDWCFLRQPINTDELYELPTPEINEILTDIKK